MVERTGVIVAEFAQRIGHAVGALREGPKRMAHVQTGREHIEHRQGRLEHRRIVALENGLPSRTKNGG